jgi:deazaflavin-dependent oxidoreductase (nitroreductase family)
LNPTDLEHQLFIFRLFLKLQIALFRLTNGALGASMRGMPVLLLTTIGRKTGRVRTTPVMYIRDGEDYVITASNSGSDRAPAWFHNLKASPQVVIEVPGKRLEAVASPAKPEEQERLWPQLVAKAPFFDGYRKRTSRFIPMVVLQPA